MKTKKEIQKINEDYLAVRFIGYNWLDEKILFLHYYIERKELLANSIEILDAIYEPNRRYTISKIYCDDVLIEFHSYYKPWDSSKIFGSIKFFGCFRPPQDNKSYVESNYVYFVTEEGIYYPVAKIKEIERKRRWEKWKWIKYKSKYIEK